MRIKETVLAAFDLMFCDLNTRNLDELKLILAGENQEIMNLVEPSASLPTWFTEEDLEAYGALYKKSGFLTAFANSLQVCRRRVQLSKYEVEAPTLLIMGEKDYFVKFPGVEVLEIGRPCGMTLRTF
ncbi:hypothetical protein HYC85_018510 [Camellia sinensis]|uniref:AB hydrolase-1 domain-containing protein n=1 Tax=Camellia sinensis TaxID=4442 RepID=A0A7J7GUH4_CAMSI|nr:hypothetical protein HYC85_018510 [Camellia sinensis]